MLQPETIARMIRELSGAGIKVLHAADLNEDLPKPAVLSERFLTTVTDLTRPGVRAGLHQCIALGYLERVQISPKKITYRVRASHKLVSFSYQLHAELARKSYQSGDEMDTFSYQHDLFQTTETDSNNETVSETVETQNGNGQAYKSLEVYRRTNETLARHSAAVIGDEHSIPMHVLIWNHARKLNDARVIDSLFMIVSKLEEQRQQTGRPQGARFTRRALRLFETVGAPLRVRSGGQSKEEFEAEVEQARAAMRHVELLEVPPLSDEDPSEEV